MELRHVRGLKVCKFNLIQLVRLFATTAAAKYNGKLQVLQTASSENSLHSFEELAMKSCTDLVGTKKSKHNTDQVTHKTD